MVCCRENVTRVLGHHGNSMCSPSGLVGKPSSGRAEKETARSPPSHLLFISLSEKFVLFALCGTTCRHNSVTPKIIIMMLLYGFFCCCCSFSQKQTTRFV